MKPFSSQILLLLVTSFLLVAFSTSRQLLAAITVETLSGRVLTGEVDEDSDDRLLWIRQEKSQIVLTTSVPWSAILFVSKEGKILPLDQLPALLRGQATSAPSGFLVQNVVYHGPTGCQGDCPETRAMGSARRLPLPQVRSLDVQAYLVNLDRDVEPDGIELIIAALDEYGVPVPVTGSLSVRLWGERLQPQGSLVRYENLEQWGKPVAPVDFADGVASYAFRFRTTRPEFDIALHSEALVNVRLGVFGQGNFSASVPVSIRNFHPFRDRLQLTRGSRFLPDELTQAGRHQLPWRTDTRQIPTGFMSR